MISTSAARGRVHLGIERFSMGRPTGQPQPDDRRVFAIYARAFNSGGSVSDPTPSEPARKKSRRVEPSQFREERLDRRFNTGLSPSNRRVCARTHAIGTDHLFKHSAVRDLAFRQLFAQLLNGLVRDVGALEPQLSETGQPLQMHQPGVGDLAIAEPQPFETGKGFQMRQSGVGDPGIPEHQLLEPGQSLQMHEPGVGELAAV